MAPESDRLVSSRSSWAPDPGGDAGHDGGVLDVPISDDMIRLGQFLKLANLIDSGSDARILLEDGSVRVNGESERRRGRQLHRGDVVTVQDHQVRVA